MKVVSLPPLILRAVTTWRWAKPAAAADWMTGIPLWLGAKLTPRYSEKTACWMATKASALNGESTHSATVPAPREPLDPEHVHTAASQQHQGKEQRRLPAGQPRPGRAAPFPRHAS